MKKAVLLFLSLCVTFVIHAAKVDTIQVYSGVMKKNIKAVVIQPNQSKGKMPVLYLLHGYSGNYQNWGKTDEVKEIADTYQMMVVCPDGANSWYWDSPENPASQYETFVAKELVNYVDTKYSTFNDRSARFITGLSMGGHGALFLVMRNQDVFGACGSMSGGVDIVPFPDSWEMSKLLGAQSEHPERWQSYSVMGNLHLLRPNGLEIIIDCGTEDFFYRVNLKLHEELLYRNIPHDYIARPGAHNWEYWKNAVKYQALFFHEYFKTNHPE